MTAIKNIRDYDPRVIAGKVNRMAKRVLFRWGSYTRRVMRSKLRRRKRISRPGEMPSIHSPAAKSLKLILFDVQLKKRLVNVGPKVFGSNDNPGSLDKGGTIVVRRKGKTEVKVVAARPFSEPTRKAVEPRLADMTQGMYR